MSLVNLAHVCSHLQNASRARLGPTSIPMTNLHLKLCLSLQKQGLFSTVEVAGLNPPKPIEQASPASIESLEKDLEEAPWLGLAYDSKEEPVERASIVPDNPAQRRIWLGMKYWNNEPVLSKMSLISKPTRRISMGVADMSKLVRGRQAGYVKGMLSPGECIFVTTDKGVYEIREAVERTLGGMLLCRTS